MPEPSDLFNNVYVKGLGVEVVKISSLLILLCSFLHSFVIKCYINLGISKSNDICKMLLLLPTQIIVRIQKVMQYSQFLSSLVGLPIHSINALPFFLMEIPKS